MIPPATDLLVLKVCSTGSGRQSLLNNFQVKAVYVDIGIGNGMTAWRQLIVPLSPLSPFQTPPRFESNARLALHSWLRLVQETYQKGQNFNRFL